MSEEAQEHKEVSRILIEFASPGSCQLDMKVQGITPEQMMFLGTFITWHANRMMEMAQQQRESQQIAVPRPGEIFGGPPEGLQGGLIRGRK